jgi:hypothetical protein
VLVDYLVATGFAATVVLHGKALPWWQTGCLIFGQVVAACFCCAGLERALTWCWLTQSQEPVVSV